MFNVINVETKEVVATFANRHDANVCAVRYAQIEWSAQTDELREEWNIDDSCDWTKNDIIIVDEEVITMFYKVERGG